MAPLMAPTGRSALARERSGPRAAKRRIIASWPSISWNMAASATFRSIAGASAALGPAKQVADQAAERGVTYVNHTFTSNLALSASLQPFAGLADHRICEYPTELQPLARDLTLNHIAPDANGEIVMPDAPGLGIEINPEALARSTRWTSKSR